MHDAITTDDGMSKAPSATGKGAALDKLCTSPYILYRRLQTAGEKRYGLGYRKKLAVVLSLERRHGAKAAFGRRDRPSPGARLACRSPPREC